MTGGQARALATAAWVALAVAVVSLAVLPRPVRGAEPIGAYEDLDETPPRFFLDRVEIGGGWGRQTCDEPQGAERANLESEGLRIHKFLSPIAYLGFDLGRVVRTGSDHPNLEEGTTGALYLGIDDQDIAWNGGLTFDPAKGFPRITGSARIGRRDDLHLSAHYARSLPVFSSDDVDVGMGTGFADANLVWIGASMPINRDVVGFKAMASVRAAPRLDVVGAWRYGNSRAGRIEGFSLSLAYVNPAATEAPVQRGLGRVIAPEPWRLEYVGAGGIIGTVAGVMVAGAAVQRSCDQAAFKPAVVGALVGGALGAVFGNAMW